MAYSNKLEPTKPLAFTYVDADLGGDEDTKRSTTGFAILLYGGIVCWLARLQTTVALSTSEAETNAAVEAVKTLMHLRLFMRELGMRQDKPSIVYEDNSACITFTEKSAGSKKTKHYQIKVHFLQEQKEAGVYEMIKVKTDGQLADTFTKPLALQAFTRYRDWMGVVEGNTQEDSAKV